MTKRKNTKKGLYMTNTEQIIKALELCINNSILQENCEHCPYIRKSANCMDELIQDVIALIKELQAHNENLKKENKYLRERLADEREHKEDMKGN